MATGGPRLLGLKIIGEVSETKLGLELGHRQPSIIDWSAWGAVRARREGSEHRAELGQSTGWRCHPSTSQCHPVPPSEPACQHRWGRQRGDAKGGGWDAMSQHHSCPAFGGEIRNQGPSAHTVLPAGPSKPTLLQRKKKKKTQSLLRKWYCSCLRNNPSQSPSTTLVSSHLPVSLRHIWESYLKCTLFFPPFLNESQIFLPPFSS